MKVSENNKKPPLSAGLSILGGRSWIVIPTFAFALWTPFAYGSNRWFSSHNQKLKRPLGRLNLWLGQLGASIYK